MIKIKHFMEMLEAEYEKMKIQISTSEGYSEMARTILIGYLDNILELIKEREENETQDEFIIHLYSNLEFKLYELNKPTLEEIA